MNRRTPAVKGSAHESLCEWNKCENILRAPRRTPLLIKLSALCLESNLVRGAEENAAVSGGWSHFEAAALLRSQSARRPKCKNKRDWALALRLPSSRLHGSSLPKAKSMLPLSSSHRQSMWRTFRHWHSPLMSTHTICMQSNFCVHSDLCEENNTPVQVNWALEKKGGPNKSICTQGQWVKVKGVCAQLCTGGKQP